jgi:hypothetical protein
VRLDEVTQIYSITSSEDSGFADGILLEYLYEDVPALRTVSRDSSSNGTVIEIFPDER